MRQIDREIEKIRWQDFLLFFPSLRVSMDLISSIKKILIFSLFLSLTSSIRTAWTEHVIILINVNKRAKKIIFKSYLSFSGFCFFVFQLVCGCKTILCLSYPSSQIQQVDCKKQYCFFLFFVRLCSKGCCKGGVIILRHLWCDTICDSHTECIWFSSMTDQNKNIQKRYD